jgi:hypothetical protein
MLIGKFLSAALLSTLEILIPNLKGVDCEFVSAAKEE